MGTFIISLLLKTNRFYLLNYLRDGLSREPFFCLKPGKQRHSDVIYGRRIKPWKFSSCQDGSN